jgi:imidazolonepropionase-like amidohydrolase
VQTAERMSLLISGPTIIDGVAERPIEGQSIWVEAGRIKAIARQSELGASSSVEVIEASGKYVIPGLMNANVHLLADLRLENLVRYEREHEHLIAEAAQIALKNGLTTVFDTAGPRQPLMTVRDKINAGQVPGSRFFCAGWIIGLDGPFSQDFLAKTPEVASAALVEQINDLCAENVGPPLSWMTPDEVAKEVRVYINKGIDFVKYASSEHRWGDPTTFLVFSPRVQSAIVEEAHQAGLTVQAHSTSVESLRVAIEAGCDLVQHCNITGPVPIPDSTLDLMVERSTGAVVFAFTQRRFEWIMETCPIDRKYFSTSDTNCRKLIQAGARLLLATDGGLFAPELATDPTLSKFWFAPGEHNLNDLGQGHFHWLKAMEEKGLPAMEILRSATINIAAAYQKDADLGTLQAGKIADMLILNRNPLQAVENYRSIHMILKDGAVVDHAALPLNPILTRTSDEASARHLSERGDVPTAHHTRIQSAPLNATEGP